jgi:hypothetical protein
MLVADAWNLVGVSAAQRTQEHNARLGKAMRELGFERKKVSIDGVIGNGYTRGEAPLKRILVYRDRDYVDVRFDDEPVTPMSAGTKQEAGRTGGEGSDWRRSRAGKQ